MQLISLTTDFGQKDSHLSVVKATLFQNIPEAKIIDISHDIEAYDLIETAYILKKSIPHFPEKTIHIIGVNSMISSTNQPIISVCKNQYYLGTNNGLLSLFLEDYDSYLIEEYKDYTGNFPLLDVFCPMVNKIHQRIDIEQLGERIESPKQLQPIHAVVQNNRLLATVIYVDNFGNLITNITREFFDEKVGERSFSINLRGTEINKFEQNYETLVKKPENNQAYHGRAMALFNWAGHLEIAIYKSNPQTVGSASTLFGYKKGDVIGIELR